jgi:hypothetical protein
MNYRDKYDIFVCGGSHHFKLLQKLLPTLRPFGMTHLASSVLTESEIKILSNFCDYIHRPTYHSNPYHNFGLFCIRDINRLAQRPYFIKLDSDTRLTYNWIHYVDNAINENPRFVAFSDHPGTDLNLKLTGALIERLVGRPLYIAGAKLSGPFYVCRTEFFKEHDSLMQGIHQLLYSFAPTSRRPLSDEGSNKGVFQKSLFELHAWTPTRPLGISNLWGEDSTRSIVIHVAGAGNKLLIVPSRGRVQRGPP